MKQLYIFGLGREGSSTYSFLRERFPERKIILLDDKPLTSLSPEWQAAAEHPYSSFTTADTLEEYTLGEAIIYVSPGIPPKHPILKQAKKDKVEISSNTSLFFDTLQEIDPANRPLVIGVTGTKGKSTTAALIHHVLESAGKNTALGGNIGKPPLDLMASRPAGIIVLELSSHQLKDLRHSPNFAVIHQVSPEHLDYYPDFQSYLEAKSQITRFQTEDDYVIYNPMFDNAAGIAELSPGTKLPFGGAAAEQPKPLSFINNNAIFYENEEIIDLSELPLKGEHNFQNVMPAVIIAKRLGISALDIRRGLQTFTPLEHRLEEIDTVNGITYVNDSLSTTPEAAIAALRSYQGRPIVLIAGGYDRSLEYSELAREIVNQKATALLYFPPTGERLAHEVNKAKKGTGIVLEKVESMAEAVSRAKALVEANGVVILSPASASFGRFADYRDRGHQFRQAVQEIS